MASQLVQTCMFLAGLVMGTATSITTKMIYDVKSMGSDGTIKYFEKPLMMTLIMFLAMMPAMPLHFAVRSWQMRKERAAAAAAHRARFADQKSRATSSLASHSSGDAVGSLKHLPKTPSTPLLRAAATLQPVESKHFFLLAIPALFDLGATALQSIGLLYTTVSLYQLSRCTIIIITALLKVFWLRQRMEKHQWAGIIINMIAMAIVGSAAFVDVPDVDPHDNTSQAVTDRDGNVSGVGVVRDPRIGIFFILCSCVVQGAQYVYEERMMSEADVPPLYVVGGEGIWGALIMFVIVYPWAYLVPGNDVGGCAENMLDAWAMICNSSTLQLIIAINVTAILGYNVFCVFVTFLLNSIWHAILDNFRPVFVWAADLCLYYYITHHAFGEAWTQGSYYQAVGMLVLFFGTAVYSRQLTLPTWCGIDYAEADRYAAEVKLMSSMQQPGDANGDPGYDSRIQSPLSSPYRTYSPLVKSHARRASPVKGRGLPPTSTMPSASSSAAAGAGSQSLSMAAGGIAADVESGGDSTETTSLLQPLSLDDHKVGGGKAYDTF